MVTDSATGTYKPTASFSFHSTPSHKLNSQASLSQDLIYDDQPITARHQAPIDGPVDYPVADKRDQTGLLTRFVPNSLKNISFYRLLLRLSRLLQFVSSVVSLGIFSQRLFKVYRLVNSIKTRRGVNGSYGAVEGILAAAVLYTLITTLFGCIKKSSNPGGRGLRWLWVLLDLLFVGAFIAVTVITRPNGGLAGARYCYGPRRLADGTNSNTITGETANAQDDSCNLPWGTFILAIISTLLHAITASFHEIKDHRHRNRIDHEKHIAHEQHANGAMPATHDNVRY